MHGCLHCPQLQLTPCTATSACLCQTSRLLLWASISPACGASSTCLRKVDYSIPDSDTDPFWRAGRHSLSHVPRAALRSGDIRELGLLHPGMGPPRSTSACLCLNHRASRARVHHVSIIGAHRCGNERKACFDLRSQEVSTITTCNLGSA